MSLFLSKFLPLLVYPVGLTWIIVIVAIFLKARPRLQRALLAFVAILLFASGNKWLAMALTRSMEWRYLPPAETPHAEVIVLLGGGTSSALYPRNEVELNGAADRMFYAAELYHQGAAPYILASGGVIDWLEQGTSGAQDMANILVRLGVPRQAIWLEEKSVNTLENAEESWKILQPKGITRVIVVTSAFHMPRAVKFFIAQGFEVIPAPTDYTVTQADWEALFEPNLMAQLIHAIPSSSNIADITRVLREYLGMLASELLAGGW